MSEEVENYVNGVRVWWCALVGVYVCWGGVRVCGGVHSSVFVCWGV